MVSINYILSAAIIMASVATAQNVAGIASQQAIRILVGARQPGVPAEKASSEASRFINDPASFSGFQKIFSEASSANANNNLNQAEALTLVHSADQEYHSWSKSPSYASYSRYFKANSKDFDFNKISSSVVELYNQYSPLIEPRLSSYVAQPQGREVSTSAVALVHRIASDFGLQRYLQSQLQEAAHNGNGTVTSMI